AAVLALAAIQQLRVAERSVDGEAMARRSTGHVPAGKAGGATGMTSGSAEARVGRSRQAARPDQGPLVLAVMAAVGVLGGGAANIAVANLVSGAVAAGVEPGPAGLILMAGSALGIGSRLLHGWLADQGRLEPLTRMVVMLLAGMVGALALTSQQSIAVANLVSGAVAAGVEPGPAGLILMAGSALGIGSRLLHGWLADQGRLEPLTRMVVMLLAGMVGALALSSQQSIAYALATPVVFAGGWAWPGLFNLVVVRANRSAPAAATGVTQTGVYVGAVAGPIIAGALIERSGYRPAWFLTAAALGLAALATLVVRALMADGTESEVERPLAPG
ncbi:MAG: MFS transporter, partial [Actinomycetota bacterium]